MSAFRSLTFASLVVSALAAPRALHASTCAAFEYETTPGPLGVVPRNAHVWVTLPSTWRRTGTCRAASDTTCASTTANDVYDLGLRDAKTGRDVKTVVEESSGDRDRVVTLRGAERLAGNARYEIWLVHRERARILGTFRTSDITDSEAPTWNARVRVLGVTGASAPPPQKGVVTLADPLALEGPSITLELDPPADAVSPHVALRVQAASTSRAIATTVVPIRAPNARSPVTITLGGSLAPCTFSTLALPRAPERVVLTLTALDIAGNDGPATTIAVQLPP